MVPLLIIAYTFHLKRRKERETERNVSTSIPTLLHSRATSLVAAAARTMATAVVVAVLQSTAIIIFAAAITITIVVLQSTSIASVLS